MIAANPMDYTSEARWRNSKDVYPLPEPEEAGESEAPHAVGDGSGEESNAGGELKKRRRRSERRYEKIILAPHLGQHVDIYV